MGAILGSLLGSAPRILRWAWSAVGRRRADHGTLRGYWAAADGLDAFVVGVAVAPSRRLRHVDIDRLASGAESLVDELFPGDFPPTGDPLVGRAAHSSDLEVRFEAARPGTTAVATARVRPDGLLDVQWPLTAHAGPAGTGPLIDPSDVLAVLRRVAAVVAGPVYGALVTSALQRPRRRVDWFVHVSAYRAAEHSQVQWAGLVLPGPQPVRAQGGTPRHFAEGIAGPEGRGRRRRADVDPLARAALARMMRGAGYHDPDHVADAIVDDAGTAGPPPAPAVLP